MADADFHNYYYYFFVSHFFSRIMKAHLI